jgi:hypothetical protein
MFVGVHAALAMRTNTPELMIEPEEGKAFMTAAQKVMRHYDVRATQKTLDWIAFAGCCGSIYGTRAFAITARKAAERDQRSGGKVIDFPFAPRPRPEAAPAAPDVPANAPADYRPSVPGEFSGAEEFSGFDA